MVIKGLSRLPRLKSTQQQQAKMRSKSSLKLPTEAPDLASLLLSTFHILYRGPSGRPSYTTENHVPYLSLQFLPQLDRNQAHEPKYGSILSKLSIVGCCCCCVRIFAVHVYIWLLYMAVVVCVADCCCCSACAVVG